MLEDDFSSAAYGGPGWSGRATSLRQELGTVWAACGVNSEWARLKSVLVHSPGSELAASGDDPDRVQMLAPLDWERARRQHEALLQAYREAGVQVHHIEPAGEPLPNQMFVADLLFMTPEGAILSRPASTVRAGEERQVARRLADLGIPILRSLRGLGTFEGADAAWVDQSSVLIGRGLRTNTEGLDQVAGMLQEMGVTALPVDLPYGTMHLMGILRFADRDLAIAWPRRTPFAAVEALRQRGYEVIFLPDEKEADRGKAFNFVTLGPRKILMAGGNPVSRAFFERAGIKCVSVEIDELAKAAGGIGCLTGILWRELV